jgi:hypothetical protein
MGAVYEKMKADLKRRRYSPRTEKSYLLRRPVRPAFPPPSRRDGQGGDPGVPAGARAAGRKRVEPRLRPLRSPARGPQLLPQPPLPQVPGATPGPLGRRPHAAGAASAPLPRRLHLAWSGAREPIVRCNAGFGSIAALIDSSLQLANRSQHDRAILADLHPPWKAAREERVPWVARALTECLSIGRGHEVPHEDQVMRVERPQDVLRARRL